LHEVYGSGKNLKQTLSESQILFLFCFFFFRRLSVRISLVHTMFAFAFYLSKKKTQKISEFGTSRIFVVLKQFNKNVLFAQVTIDKGSVLWLLIVVLHMAFDRVS
jgi:hypothetical protein